MTWTIRLAIALAMTAVIDRAANDGALTLQAAEQADDLGYWASHGGGKIVESFIGWRS